MSGRKNVTIDSYELRNLRSQAARATTLSQANDALNRINQHLSASVDNAERRITALTNDLNRMNQTLSANQRAANAQVTALRTQLQDTVRASNQRLAQINEENSRQLQTLQANFDDAIRQTRRDAADAIAENNRRVEEAMNRNNEIISQRIDSTNQRIDVIDTRLDSISDAVNGAHGDLQTLADMAREFMDMARRLNEDSQRYRCELLLPGAFKPVQEQFNTAQSQLKLPLVNAPAAQLSARQAYLDALAFHERVVQAEQEWILRHQAAQQAVAEAQARIDASGTVTEEATKIPINVDHWSDGDLSQLAEDAEGLMRHLQRDASGDSMEDLENIRRRGEQLQDDALDTAAFALGAALNSQFRASIAQALANSLRTSNNLQVVDHGYQGNDMRGAHRVHLRNNVTGLSLVITQTPVVKPDGSAENRLELDIADPGTCNDATARAVANDIRLTLQRAGMNVGALNTVPGCEDINTGRREAANLSQWRTETVPVTRPQHLHRTSQSAASAKN